MSADSLVIAATSKPYCFADPVDWTLAPENAERLQSRHKSAGNPVKCWQSAPAPPFVLPPLRHTVTSSVPPLYTRGSGGRREIRVCALGVPALATLPTIIESRTPLILRQSRKRPTGFQSHDSTPGIPEEKSRATGRIGAGG